MENPIKMDDLGGPPQFLETHMDTIVFIGPLTSNSHHQDHYIMLSVGDARSLTFLPIVATVGSILKRKFHHIPSYPGSIAAAFSFFEITCEFEDSGAFWLLISMEKMHHFVAP